MSISKTELVEAGHEFIGGNVIDLSHDELLRLMTVTQYVTDLCLNEIELRGELPLLEPDGQIMVPYMCEYFVETILTRK